MKLTQTKIPYEEIILTEDAAEVILELGPKKFILRHRGDGVLVFINYPSKMGDDEFPVRRMYVEPISDGLLIMQWIPEFDEEGRLR